MKSYANWKKHSTMVSYVIPRSTFSYDHFLNILGLFDVLPNFPFTANERKRDY